MGGINIEYMRYNLAWEDSNIYVEYVGYSLTLESSSINVEYVGHSLARGGREKELDILALRKKIGWYGPNFKTMMYNSSYIIKIAILHDCFMPIRITSFMFDWLPFYTSFLNNQTNDKENMLHYIFLHHQVFVLSPTII